ncbi:hypothetical protein EZJ19_10730 [Parasulfuritortus cantonensis]|uniref:Uncharacterized protein n=2 Tax=Parasulfuritortus cantonensis TaxID=2528202 RepID=A0A4R1B8K5_9PROT|nr:hypothetical protein EZJ19_10730 [Parasulfuritortus cantonensis]
MSGSALTITARAAGKATITVRNKHSTAKVAVSVTGSSSAAPSAGSTSGLTATPSSVSLAPGQSATVKIGNARTSLSVSVANTGVASATVSKTDVKITAKKVGSTYVTVKDRYSKVVVPVVVQTGTTTTSSTYTLLAWNDLGMHCMDGDYSVFAILPPYNNLHAQLVDSGTNKLVTQGVTLTYEAMADADGSINTISSTKTNFWQYVENFFGVSPAPDTGLTGNKTASLTPQPMAYDSAARQFVADGIPITPYDDSFHKNTYPMVKVVAKDASGKQLAQARVVLPVSDEMSCSSCHASNSDAAAKPQAGWVNDASLPERDWKRNILRLHDEKQAADAAYASALAGKGYDAAGLLATADAGKPVLCASCHASNALAGTGVAGIKPLTEAIHGHHATVKDPASGVMLDSITNRSSCYQCHPGSETKCLRGVMGNAVDANGKPTIDCQSCHGTMSNVGRSGRVGWLDEPNCQACHHDGQRELSAVSSTGILKVWLDNRYATNANAPAAGFSLYRFSSGHGSLQCEACHGATHAEYPSSHRNDNVLANDVQGRSGTIGECSACHKSVPLTATGGPHGMHTIGSAWVSGHESYAESNKTACAYCHGADYRGSALSTAKAARSFSVEGKTVTYSAGQKVTCYDCHNGPNGD